MAKAFVTVTDNDFKAHITLAEVIFQTGLTPSFDGELLAINPSREEFAKFDQNFASAVEAGVVPEVVEGVVYFDTGAQRAYHLEESGVSIEYL